MREKTKIFENSFEDYGLSKEAIICLKSVGCNNPQDVYEKVPLKTKYRYIGLDEICFYNGNIANEIRQKLGTDDYLSYATNENESEIVVTEESEEILSVTAKCLTLKR